MKIIRPAFNDPTPIVLTKWPSVIELSSSSMVFPDKQVFTRAAKPKAKRGEKWVVK